VTQHSCTEELRLLREGASHETTSLTKHWGSPSKNQHWESTDPREQIALRRPAVSTKVREPPPLVAGAGAGPPDSRYVLKHGHTSVETPTAGRAARFKTFYSIFYYC